MCLIIQREPNFEIPYGKFETAVLNNGDGYGVAVPDGSGKLIVIRSADKPDPEALYRILNEELFDQRILVHLRYTTAGETILRNSHPFPILEKDKDGIDLRMAHNGTLYEYKQSAAKGESDTRAFVREYVRPLFKRMSRGMGPEELLSDEFIKEILEDKLTTASVLSFIDGDGNTMNCNEAGNGGKQEDGWYYSNTYSFNATHRVPAKTTSTYYDSQYYQEWVDTLDDVPQKKPNNNTVSTLDKTFLEIFEITSVDDLALLSDNTIKKIAHEMPIYGTKLIKDLLREVYHADIEIGKLKAKLNVREKSNVK